MAKYILLGIVQGLTEFLPVSSSGHLVVMQKVFGLSGQELALTVLLHLGTLLALFIFFFKDILEAFRNFQLLLFILIVTIITGIIGILGKDFFESLFSSTISVGMGLFVTGLVLILTKRSRGSKRDILDITDAIVLGFAQSIAIIPGISRSGITISALIFRKIDRETCFKFSFLASLPAILGAAILEAREINSALQASQFNLVIGITFSFLSGLIALWVLKKAVVSAKFHYFGYYCMVAAVITLLFIK